MTARSHDALASLLLTQRLIDVSVKPLSSKEYWQLTQSIAQPSQLLGATTEGLRDDHGLSAEMAQRLVRLLDAGAALAMELERLEQQGLRALSPFDAAYPDRLLRRLGTTAPPVLYAAGPTALLEEPGIAVVGSRNVSDEGARVAQQVATLTAKQGLSLISGGAKGTDQLAMSAATEAGGTAVGVLADSLERRLRQPDVRRAISDERVCLVTPYKPTAGFSVANAMARNKIVYGLARVTLVVAADAEKGGTWEGAAEALRREFGPVAVWTGSGGGDGNALLADKGARPVDEPRQVLQERPPEPPDAGEQLRLGV